MYSENNLFPPTSPLRWPLLFLVSCVSSWDVLYRLSCRYAHTDIFTQVVAQHTHLLQQVFFSALHLSGPSGSIIHEEWLHSFSWLHDIPLHEGVHFCSQLKCLNVYPIICYVHHPLHLCVPCTHLVISVYAWVGSLQQAVMCWRRLLGRPGSPLYRKSCSLWR